MVHAPAPSELLRAYSVTRTRVSKHLQGLIQLSEFDFRFAHLLAVGTGRTADPRRWRGLPTMIGVFRAYPCRLHCPR